MKGNKIISQQTTTNEPAATSTASPLLLTQQNDPLEREADRVADKIMRVPEQHFIQRKCAHCEEEESLQRKPLASFIQRKESTGDTAVSDGVSNQINASKGNGNSIDTTVQSFMESRFGADFRDIKIHTDKEAIQMNRELNARAFTVGSDIYFNEGQYQPSSSGGQHLLAHELTHTIQQNSLSGNNKNINRAGQEMIMRDTINADSPIYFETASLQRDLYNNKQDFSEGNYAVELLRRSTAYQQLRSELMAAFKIAYPSFVPQVFVTQIPEGQNIACGKSTNDSDGCCDDCNTNCNPTQGVPVVNFDFHIDSRLFGYAPFNVIPPPGFKVKDDKNTFVATASTMFHELLHLWFFQVLCVAKNSPAGESSGHGIKTLGPPDPTTGQRKEQIFYEPEFAKRWQQAQTEFEAAFEADPYVTEKDSVMPAKTSDPDLDSANPDQRSVTRRKWGLMLGGGAGYSWSDVNSKSGMLNFDVFIDKANAFHFGSRFIVMNPDRMLTSLTGGFRLRTESPLYVDVEAGIAHPVNTGASWKAISAYSGLAEASVGHEFERDGVKPFIEVSGLLILKDITNKPDENSDMEGAITVGGGFTW